MHISLDKFLALTATLAVGSGLALACSSDDDGGTNGAGPTTSSGGTGGSSGSSSTGTGGSGTGGSGTGGSGTGGSVSSTGGSDAGGAAGSSGEGAGGDAGAAGAMGDACLESDPAEEGYGFDCSTLPYYEEDCPNPSGEGLSLAPAGVSACWYHAENRTASVELLTDCLAQITAGTEGYCGAEHRAAVDQCLAEMQSRTCASTAAETACTTLSDACAEIDEAKCVGELSVLDDSRVTDDIVPCVASSDMPSSACGYVYRSCSDLPDEYLDVDDACQALREPCSAIDNTECTNRLDIYGAGVLLETTYYGLVVACMQTEQEENEASCDAAFLTCTEVWAD